jgi:hypothetical protein
MLWHTLELLGDSSAQLLWLGLLHSLWIGTAAAALLALVLRLGPRLSRRSRHVVGLAALAVATLGPALAAPVHSVLGRHRARVAPDDASARLVGVDEPSGVKAPVPSRPERWIAIEPPNRDARIGAFARSMTSNLVDALRHSQLLVMGGWLTGTCGMTLLIVVSGHATRRICRRAQPAPPAIAERALRLARRLELKSPPRVLADDRVNEPCLCGVFRTSILLPRTSLRDARGDFLDAILAHELAHARRHDHVVNLAQRLVEAVLFFHPSVRWISRFIRREREFCADALAVRATGQPLALARALESVARRRLFGPKPRSFSAALGGDSCSLLPRIEELFGMVPEIPRLRVWPLFALPAAGLLACLACSAGMAQDGRPAVYGSPAATATHLPRDGARQVSFEVRYWALDAEPWRNSIVDRLRLVHEEADVSVWTIDDHALFDLLTSAQENTSSNVLQAPKATTFEDAHVKIHCATKEYFTTRLDKIASAGTISFRPTSREIEVGTRLDVAGSRLREGTRLSVDLGDTSVASLHKLARKAHAGDHDVVAEYQIPTVVQRRCKLTCDVPDKASLLISLGLHERRGRLSDAGEAASGLLERVGLPPVPARPVPVERLITIRSRWIEPEREGQRTPAGKVSDRP